MKEYKKNLTALAIMSILFTVMLGANYFVFKLSKKSFSDMQQTVDELIKVRNETGKNRKASPELRRATEQLLEYALKKDDSIVFLDNLEKNMQKVATSTSIVSAQARGFDTSKQTALFLSIKSNATLNQILSVLNILENTKYLSYIDKVDVERVSSKENTTWQANISFVVFTR